MNLKSKELFLGAVMIGGLFLGAPARALAASYYTLSPTTGNHQVGDSFEVIMGINSGTEKVVGVDLVATFDATRLEIQSVRKGTVPDDGYQFYYTDTSPIIDNNSGRLEVTLPSSNPSVYTGVAANHELLKITFRAKAVGTATLNYVCQANSIVETNMINELGNDVVECASNQSGSYTIAAGAGGATSTPIPTATPTTVAGATATPISGSSSSSTTTSTSTTTTTSLPETGGVAETIALMILGVSGMAVALYLKLI